MVLKNKNLSKMLFGIILTLPAIGIIYTEYIKGITIIDEEVQVVVLKDNAQKNTPIISEDMLVYQKKDIQDIQDIAGVITDKAQVIGKETVTFVPKNSVLVDQYFEESYTNLSDDEFVFNIPENWLYSYPQTIRRMDKVYIYPVNVTAKDSSGFQANTKMPEGNPILETVVLFAKDGSNREVIDMDSNERYNGSSQVSEIEIKVTQKDVEKMEKYISNGYKFLLYYN